MATIRKRGEYQWQAQIRHKGFPLQTKTFNYREDAEKWARAVEREMDAGSFTSSNVAERTTLRELIEDFKTEFAPMHYRQREDRKEAWRFQLARIEEALGDYSLASLDQRLVAGFRDQRLKGSARRPAAGESTVRKELYMLSKVLGFAQTEKGITLPRGNPVDKIRKPRESKGRERRLSQEEWEALSKECRASRNPWLWPSVTLAVETAMRQGELLALEWKNIDLKRRLALLPITKNGETRVVPLSPAALKALKALPRSLSGRVIPVGRVTLYSAFGAACQRAEIADMTFHDLRHEALSRLAERDDFSVLELAAISGHKTLQVLKRYTHLQAEKLAAKLAGQG